MMANSVPTLTNENWHMFEPSPLETSLAVKTGDVNAFPLMMSARGRNQNAGMNYQAQVDQMHAAQIAEAMMAQQTARGGMLATSLKDASGTPGMTDVLRQLNIMPQGVDTSQFDAGVQANASSKNMGEAGRGLGSLMLGGGTGLGPAVQSVFGLGAGQGPAAIVQAAQVKEAGANARHASGSGAATYSAPYGAPGPNQGTVHVKVPTGLIPGLPPWAYGRGASAGGANSVDDSGDIGGSDLSAPLPQAMTDAALTPSSNDQATLIKADIAASKVPPQQTAEGIVHTGASGKKYLVRNK